MALIQAVAQGHLMPLPVDLWIVLCKPSKSEDDVQLPKVGNSECGPLGVAKLASTISVTNLYSFSEPSTLCTVIG